ncbi:hypothetical protein JOB18_032838 [Solea senegalensis]|uniref:Uncharacterized protein n=1 Tax=Solea senegalensis TaxID=28829 RepID=A0AAV6QXW7_SOLSE|nr:hypothetical protein JOB18_032838 [Solea senegalensis]
MSETRKNILTIEWCSSFRKNPNVFLSDDISRSQITESDVSPGAFTQTGNAVCDLHPLQPMDTRAGSRGPASASPSTKQKHPPTLGHSTRAALEAAASHQSSKLQQRLEHDRPHTTVS